MPRHIQTNPNIQPTSGSLAPEELVELRGERSRSDFAKAVGVSPLTVYRWELPPSAKESRRPRGQVLERLRRLAEAKRRTTPAGREVLDPDDRAAVLPVLERMFSGDLRGAEIEFVALLAAGRLRTPSARLFVCAHLALAQVLGRNDARSAFVTLTPALASVPAGALSIEAEVAVHLAAAWIFAAPIGELYDPPRAEAHAAAIEALDPSAAEVHLLAWAAVVSAWLPTDDGPRLAALFARADALVSRASTPLARLHAEVPLAVAALLGGAAGAAVLRLEALLLRADVLPTLRARALALLALHALDSLGDPRRIIALAQQARDTYVDARVMPDLSLLHAVRAEGDALARLGLLAEAAATFDLGERAAAELRFPALMLWSSQARLALLTGDDERLERALHRFRRVDPPLLRAQAEVHALHAETRLALHAVDGARALEFATRALERTRHGVCPGVTSELLVARVTARLLCGTPEEALADVHQAQQALERFPSPLHSSLLRLLEAFALARLGRVAEALPRVEAVQATLALTGNRPVGVLAAWCHARLSGADVAEIEAEAARLGVAIPLAFRRACPAAPLAARDIAPLLVPVMRLSVRGIAPALICKELHAIASTLLPNGRVRLDLLGPTGQATLLHGEPAPPLEGPRELVEFSDGCGRHYRLAADGALTAEPRAWLSALASLAGLSLEVASLRGLSQGPATDAVPAGRGPELPGFIAASPAMRGLLAEIAGLAGSDATVLITGESGAGKELVARALHDLSPRAAMPYVAFNCAAIPSELFEGQLFGHRKGAFTGAAADHPGIIRAAQGGTLLLDEIAELSLESQAKLLRFLENRELLPLGELRPIQVDVRVLASTNQDLAALVRARRFREDLYFRLHVVPLHVPPLRERPEDILALARHFLRAAARDPEGAVLTPDAMTALLEHRWPGNARELKNVIERALARAPQPRLVTARHLRIV